MRSTILRCWLAVIILGLVTSVSFAQPGGRGGFGGRTLRILGSDNWHVNLAGNAAVQKELAVSDEQAQKLAKLTQDYTSELEKVSAEASAAQNKVMDIQNQGKAKLAEILDAGQMERLVQIARQTAGIRLFFDAEILTLLDLSPDQRNKLRSLQNEYSNRQRLRNRTGFAPNQPTTPNGGALGDQPTQEELSRSFDTEVAGILSETQQAQLAKLKGEKFAGSAGAQNPVPFGFSLSATAPARLLDLVTARDVERDLKLSDEQVGRFKRLSDNISEEIRQANANSVNDQQQKAREIHDSYRPKLNQILNPEQLARLEQIVLQTSGSDIYLQSEVVDKLQMTQDQQKQISGIFQEFNNKRRELTGSIARTTSPDGMQKYLAQVGELMHQRDKDLLAVLTADQQQRLTEMKGREFDLTQLRPRAFGTGPNPFVTPSRAAAELENSTVSMRIARQLRYEAFATAMKVTAEQRKQLNEIEAQLTEALRSYPQSAKEDSDEVKQWRTRFTELDTRFLNVLSEDQKKFWSERDSPVRARELTMQGRSLVTWGQLDKALELFGEAIKLDGRSAMARNERAWLQATTNDVKYRNGKQAIDDATKACELTEWKVANFIDTLAAAYAESGDFENAVKYQERALEGAEEAMKAQFADRLKLYEERKPYREAARWMIQSTRAVPALPRELQNPGFEFGTENWEAVTVEALLKIDVDSEVFHEGKSSLRISATQPSDGIVGQEILLRPHGWHRFSGWVRTRNLDPQQAKVYGTFQIQSQGGREVIATGANHKGDADWTEVTFDFEAPSRGATRICPIFVSGEKGTGEAWFDGLKIEELSVTETVNAIFAHNKPFDFDFRVKDIDEKPLVKSEFAGKVLIVDVWGTWCPPCRKEIPHLVALQKQYADAGLVIVGLHQEHVKGDEAVELVKTFREKNEMNYRCALVEHSLLETIPGFHAFPTTLFIDRSGVVRATVVGYQEIDKLELMTKKLLDERN